MTRKIMIVDDSASMRQLVSFTLRDAGYEVVEAVSAEDALSKLDVQGTHMVLTDLNMPGLDGIELIRKLRNGVGFKFKPIIMLTTESKECRKDEGRAAGASGWIVKPFTPDRLVDVVSRLIR